MKIRHNIIFSILLSLTIFSTESIAATFQVEASDCSNYIWIKGEIEKGDSLKLSTKIKEVNEINTRNKTTCYKESREIFVNSLGGDVAEAIKLGYMIKEGEFNVSIRSIDKCYSSCVLILAAGIERNPTIAKIGIHRPYFSDLDEKLSLSQIRQRRDELKIKIKSYLEDMDVDPSLAELMLQTAPDDIKILSESELKQYRLSMPDANHEERETAKRARFYSLTSSEYRKRDSLAEYSCKQYAPRYDRYMNDVSGNGENRIVCRESIIWNISANEYQRRASAAKNNCNEINDRSERLICYKKYLTQKF